MSLQKKTSPADEMDLDATAELPIIEFDEAATAIAEALPE
jgi:hypothetical protein